MYLLLNEQIVVYRSVDHFSYALGIRWKGRNSLVKRIVEYPLYFETVLICANMHGRHNYFSLGIYINGLEENHHALILLFTILAINLVFRNLYHNTYNIIIYW